MVKKPGPGRVKSTRTGTTLSTSNLSTLLLKLVKAVRTFSDLSIFNLSTSDHKFTKSTFLVSFHVSTPVPFYKSAFVA